MARNPTSFLRLEMDDEKEIAPKDEGFGLSDIKHKRRSKIRHMSYIVCPLCCLNRPLNRTGSYSRMTQKRKSFKEYKDEYRIGADGKTTEKTGKKIQRRSAKYNPNGETRFDLYDTENAPFISVRQYLGAGVKSGISEVAIVTLEGVKGLTKGDKEMVLPLIQQLRAKCKEILKATEDVE